VRGQCDPTRDKYIRDRLLEINTKEIHSMDKNFHENGKHLCNLIFVGLFFMSDGELAKHWKGDVVYNENSI
jgi:hypothetical protein